MRALGALLALLVTVPSLGAAISAPRVLVASGTKVDGVGLAEFDFPVATGDGGVAFLGGGPSIVQHLPDGDRVLVASGDVLPPPLAGSFNRFTKVAVNAAGVVTFAAELNSSGTDRGIFSLDGSTLVPVAVAQTPSSDKTDLVALTANAGGDVAYLHADGVYRWLRATGDTTAVAVLPESARFRLPPVIDDGGAVVWVVEGELDGVYYWSAASGIRAVATEKQSSPLGGAPYASFANAAATTDASAGVAFVAAAGDSRAVFLWSPTTETTTIVAKPGDPVVDRSGVSRSLGVPNGNFIRVESNGDVVFRAALSPAAAPDERRELIRATHQGLIAIAEDSPPAVAIDGEVALYVAADGGASRIVGKGNVIPGAGPMSFIEPGYAGGGGTLLFAAVLDDQRFALGRVRNGVLTKVAADGDPAPHGGTLSIRPYAFDADGEAVAFTAVTTTGLAAVFVARGTRPLRAYALKTSPSAEDALAPAAVALVRGKVFLQGQLARGGAGIFVSHGSRFAPVVLPGDRVPDSGAHFGDNIEELRADGGRVLFVASVRPPGSNDSSRLAIFRLRDGRPSPIPGGNADMGNGFLVGSFGNRALFFVRFFGRRPSTPPPGLYVTDRRGPQPLLVDGVETGVGRVTLDDPNFGVTVAGHTVFVASTLTGGTSRVAIFAIDAPPSTKHRRASPSPILVTEGRRGG